TLGWPKETPELSAFYPTDTLVTARDIIFLWVARMVMMGVEFTGQLPFTDVPITSVIQAPDGRRMSKSLGTGIDPLDEIDAHGADGVRFGLLHPIMPFVTEEVWSYLPGERGLLAAASWPVVDSALLDEEAEAVVGRTIQATTALRRYRDDVGAPAAARLPAWLSAEGYEAT